MSMRLSLMARIVTYLSMRRPFVAAAIRRVTESHWLRNRGIYRRAVMACVRARDADLAPPQVWIETTLDCNARCAMCLHAHRDLKGTMSGPLFEKIIEECARMGIKTIGLSVYGEPLLDPLFMRRVACVREQGLRYMLSTNAHLLDAALAAEMLRRGGIERINFSVNGYSREVYESTMVGLDRDRTYDHIRAFLDALTRSDSRTDTTVTISCVRTGRMTKHELSAFRAFWSSQKGVDGVLVWDAIDHQGNPLSAPGSMRSLARAVGLWKPPCREAWDDIKIYHDGRVSPCCMDFADRTLVIGNEMHHTLPEILGSDAYASFRALHRDGRRHEHPACRACNFPSYWY